ncbi:hypothetical protein T440DRAFT_498095 [Plenodomus tracheiphilus IPT5]|uniref:EGF-like domain-containing protein n=1 Tax=Plenodomus tracheiphilus IPT5 TaxID=1408161 RepID=A0A6A7BBE5_9PLEO|nr:hypothetical protein T440DRAFT_498095 [Plenodomus tracheiphilus IPT5]
MRSFVFGALLLRTLNAQVLADPSASATLAPLLTPGPDAPTESQLSESAAAVAEPIATSASPDVVVPFGIFDTIISESPTNATAATPTAGLEAAALSSSDTATTSAASIVLPVGPGALAVSASASSTLAATNLASNIGAQAAGAAAARPNANYAGSARPGGGGWSDSDDSSYDGQDYGDDWDDGQTEGAPDGSDSYGADIECPADCTCEAEKTEYDSHEGYPPPPGYSPPPTGYTPTPVYSPYPEPTPDYPDGGDEGGEDTYPPGSRRLRARQAASGGFAQFNWPGASDGSGDGASEDLPDWLYDSAGVAKPKPRCPKACCNKPTEKYPTYPAPVQPSGYVPAPTGYVGSDAPAPTEEPWYDSNSTTPDSGTPPTYDTPATPTWTTLVSPVAAAYAPAKSADYTGDTLAGICPKTCNPDSDKNFCDITTSCTTTGGSKNYCACRAGYMASAWNAKDFSKQFHVDGQPFVYVAPGVVCDKVCDDYTCKDVLTRPKCA